MAEKERYLAEFIPPRGVRGMGYEVKNGSSYKRYAITDHGNFSGNKPGIHCPAKWAGKFKSNGALELFEERASFSISAETILLA